MKVALFGAYGHLGSDIQKELVRQGHEVLACDAIERELVLEGSGRSTFVKIDATKPETLEGVCENVDCVITTVGLTKASATVSCYDIDLNGNKNILAEAKRAGVKKFVYISVIHADEHAEIPMLDAKAKMEEEVKKSGIPYIIYRPTGYFYDIVHVLKPMVEKGAISLLGKEPGVANVIATEDFAEYIVDHLGDENVTVSIGGRETYNYDEIAKMCFDAVGKPCVIKRAPVFLFDILIFVNALKKNGKADIIKFSKFTLTGDLVGEVKYGKQSFSAYLEKEMKITVVKSSSGPEC